MSSGNMFMALGAILILSFLSLNINRSILNSRDVSSRTEYMISAQGILQQLSEEIRNKPFDAAVISDANVKTESFTRTNSFGLSTSTITTVSSENITSSTSYLTGSTSTAISSSSFKDVDDYNNTSLSYVTPRSGSYTAYTTVSYVNPDDPSTTVSYTTHSKRVDIRVVNPFMRDTLRTSFLVSY